MKFLIDVQLPPNLCKWVEEKKDHARHAIDIQNGLTLSDVELWQIAVDQKEIIITKDSDFLDRYLLFGSPPRILYISVGNCSNKKLFEILDVHWNTIYSLFKNGSEVILVEEKLVEYW
ncbi:MAG: DUF5615 family PIN-like protein [Balneolales bacterium]